MLDAFAKIEVSAAEAIFSNWAATSDCTAARGTNGHGTGTALDLAPSTVLAVLALAFELTFAR